jgi:hypothetical protein
VSHNMSEMGGGVSGFGALLSCTNILVMSPFGMKMKNMNGMYSVMHTYRLL